MGHALELAEGGHPLIWSNDTAQATYILTPMDMFEQDNRPCRTFSLEIRTHERKDVSSQRACRSHDGRWDLVAR